MTARRAKLSTRRTAGARHFLIDRGAAETPAPYLAKDGIPYRVFDATQARWSPRRASSTRRPRAYLEGCLDKVELAVAIDALVAAGKVRLATLDGKEAIVAG